MLNDRLAEIDLAVREMSKSFGALRDELTSSDLLLQRPRLQQGLQRLAEKSDALVRLSAGPINSQPLSELKSSSSDAEDVKGIIHGTDESEGTSSLPDVSSDVIGGSPDEFNALYSSTSNTSIGGDDFVNNTNSHHQRAKVAGMGMTTLSPYNQMLQAPVPPTTYSFLESSFSCRLRRHYLEYSYRLLSDPRADPRDVLRVFCFSLGFRSRPTMLDRFQTALSRSKIDDHRTATPSNNSNNSSFPIAIPPTYHIGNAGTHFPQNRDQQAYPLSKFIGPWPFHLADIPHEKSSIDELQLSRGITGEWFDANDIEGYLHSMGVPIDAQSSFVAVPSPPSSLSEASSSPPAPSSIIDPFASSTTNSIPIDPSISANGAFESSFNIGMDVDLDMNMNMNMNMDFLAAMAEPEKLSSQPGFAEYPFSSMSAAIPPGAMPFTADDNNIKSNININTNNNYNYNNTSTRILDVAVFIDREHSLPPIPYPKKKKQPC